MLILVEVYILLCLLIGIGHICYRILFLFLIIPVIIVIIVSTGK